MHGVWREVEITMFYKYQFEREFPNEEACEFLKKIDKLAYERFRNTRYELNNATKVDNEIAQLRQRSNRDPDKSVDRNSNYKRVLRDALDKEVVVLTEQQAKTQKKLNKTITEIERKQINSFLVWLGKEIIRINGRITETSQS